MLETPLARTSTSPTAPNLRGPRIDRLEAASSATAAGLPAVAGLNCTMKSVAPLTEAGARGTAAIDVSLAVIDGAAACSGMAGIVAGEPAGRDRRGRVGREHLPRFELFQSKRSSLGALAEPRRNVPRCRMVFRWIRSPSRPNRELTGMGSRPSALPRKRRIKLEKTN